MGQFNSRECIKETNFPEDMLEFVTQAVTEAVNKHRHSNWGSEQSQSTGSHLYDDQEICDDINRALLSKYGGRWYCMAGPHAVFPEVQRPPKFIYFEYKTTEPGNLFGTQKYRIFVYSFS